MTQALEVKSQVVQGLITNILEIEAEADVFKAKAKELQDKADKIREDVLSKLNTLGIKSIKHQSGMNVTSAVRRTIKITDDEAVIDGLRKYNVVMALTQVVPEHREVKSKLFTDWVDGQGLDITEFNGLDIKETNYLSITKPK